MYAFKKKSPVTTGKFTPIQVLTLFYGALASIVLSIASSAFLSERYFNDPETIASYFGSGDFLDRTNSYAKTAYVFEVLGLSEPSVLSVVGPLVVCITTIAALFLIPPEGRSWLPAIAALGAMILGGIYLGKFSKDILVLPIILLFMFTAKKWYFEVFWLVPALAFAATIRNYWFLVIALYIGWRIVLPSVQNLARLVVYFAIATIAISLVFNSLLGVPADFYRTSVNESLNTERQTEIVGFITSNAPHLQAVNLLIVLLTLLIPVPLLLAGSIAHVVSAIGIGGLWIITIRNFIRARFAQRKLAQGPGLSSARSANALVSRPLALLFAYVLTQSLFEPDYGSYVRHLTPLLPLFVLVLGALNAELRAQGLDRRMNSKAKRELVSRESAAGEAFGQL